MGAVAGLLAAAALALGADGFARGQVTDRVSCAETPGQSYALYLPTAYTPEKRWPVLYMLDARGRALVPIERFRAAAEEFGWILVSSYNTRSDTTDDPNTPAVQAMWKDTHARLAIDPRRMYLTGFSGGARTSVAMASYEPLGIAGVIGCGAGFHDDAAPIRKAPGFAYFGTVGNRDFNYYEMRALDEKLAGAKADYRIEVFDGAHDWPPPPVARHAIAWMEVQAIRRGARPREDAAVAALYQEDLARARALESEGRAQDALARYERIAADFRGLSDTPEASAKAAALGQSAPIRKAQKEARRRDARDVAALNELSRKLSRAMKASEIPTAGFLGAELGIPALRKQAASAASPEDRLSAERLLANLRVQTSFYVPERMFAANDATHALLALGVAAEIDPEEPTVYYNLACGHARAGQTTRALEALDLAVARGFQRFELLDTDPDFARVREDPAFRAWAAAHKE